MITGRFNENFRYVNDLPNRDLPDDTLEEIADREELQDEDVEMITSAAAPSPRILSRHQG